MLSRNLNSGEVFQAQPGGAVGYPHTQFFPHKIPKYLKIVKHYPARRAASAEKETFNSCL